MLGRAGLVLAMVTPIVGCSSALYESPAPFSSERAEEPEEVRDVPVKNSRPVGKSEEGVFSELESLLVYRERACRLSEGSRDELLRGYRELETPTAVMATLMLASCAPDKTPGLLANSLVEARRLENNTPGFDGLLSLLEAQLRSYSLIETELKKTRSRLDEMINGLREIEAEMGQDARGQE